MITNLITINMSEFELITLFNDDVSEIKYVYHLSDIHIRNTQRHIEYKEVFERTYEKIRTDLGENNTNSLIVLTGDIMHSKTILSPDSFDMSCIFFEKLSEIAPVIIIAGNHDCNLLNKDRMDALTPAVKKFEKCQNVHYLKYSGLFRYNNIIFGVSSLLDNKFVYANNITEEMFTDIAQKNKYKIALYHGMLKGSKMDNGFVPKNDGLTIKYFNGYDYVMLGDLHTHQIVNSGKTMAYAGSLIQQSHGESLNNHGFLKWDLLKRKIKLIEVENDYGFCTIHIKNGKMIDTHIPKNPYIKFILENTNQIQFKEIENDLAKKFHIREIIEEHVKNYDPYSYQKYDSDVNTYCDEIDDTKINSFLKLKKIEKNDRTEIIKLHNHIEKKITEDNDDEKISNSKWKILELKFSNMLSFGINNIIDFRNYNMNQIIGIFAPNHYGKSSILDIILFCIFDKCTRGDRRDILNKNKNEMSCSLLLEIGNQKYLIERNGKRSLSKNSVKIDVRFFRISYDKSGNEIMESLTGLEKNNTNKIITNLLGDYNDYLTTCICIQQQGKHGNFLDMTHLQKKEYLSEILKLNVFDQCCTYAKDKLKSYSTQLKTLEKEIQSNHIDDAKQNYEKLSEKLSKVCNKKIQISNNLELLKISSSFVKMPELTKYHDLSEHKLNSESEITKTIDILTKEIHDSNESDFLHKKSQCQQSITKLKTIKPCDAVISKYNTELEKLYTQIINIPNDINKFDSHELKQQQAKLENDIIDIDKMLSSLNTKLYITNPDHSRGIILDFQELTDTIKKEISTLKNSIKYVDPESNNKLAILTEKLKKNRSQLFKASVSYFNNPNNLEQNNILIDRLNVKNNFAAHINDTIDCLNLCANKNEIKPVLDLQYQWLNDYNDWKSKTTQLISNTDHDLPNIEKLNKNATKLNKNIISKSFDVLTLHDNNNINIQISKLENKLDILNQINNYGNQREIFCTKLKVINDNIKNQKIYKNYISSNEKINDEIAKIKDKITNLESTKSDTKTKINKFKSLIKECDDKLDNIKTYKHQLQLLELYKLQFTNYMIQREKYDKLIDQKNELEILLNDTDKAINDLNIKIAIEENIIEQSKKTKDRYDNILKKSKLYDLYSKIMDFNGIPYEILKSALPQIEAKVNQTLHNMVDFNVEFLLYDESQIAANKIKQLKANIGTININICYHNQKPYNVQLASGFEKFIIGLSIRMVLCEISQMTKPNFFIIDEGWSCLDNENLNNIDTIMNYIKNQFEHVIIISHLDELKNQADYVINIDKRKGFSHVNNQITPSAKRGALTKNKSIKVIEV